MRWVSRFRVVSYYTPDYADYARGLEDSLAEHMPDTPREIVPISQRSWESGTSHKGAFVRDMLASSDRGVLWIDADAVVRRPFEVPNVDVAVYARFSDRIRHRWSPLRSGTVYLGKTLPGAALADVWAEECVRQRDGVDQWALWRAWLAVMQQGEAIPSTFWLPRAFCQKHDEPGAEPVIEHLMASRTRRGK